LGQKRGDFRYGLLPLGSQIWLRSAGATATAAEGRYPGGTAQVDAGGQIGHENAYIAMGAHVDQPVDFAARHFPTTQIGLRILDAFGS